MLPRSPLIDRCKTGVLAPLAFLAGTKLDVFSQLDEGPASVQAIGRGLNVDPDWLQPLLFALAASELLIHENGTFRNSPEASHYLVRGKPNFIGDVHRLYEELWRGAFLAAESVKARKPLAAHDYANMSEDVLSEFFRGQHPDALLAGWKLAEAIDLSKARRLADVGGGSGGVAIAVCGHYPNLGGTVLDLPAVSGIAARYIEESDVADRISVMSCDVLNAPIPGDYDVVVMRSLLQVLSPDDCMMTLRNVRPAVAPGGRLLILGQIVDDDRIHPETAAMFNLVFLSFYGPGRVYTESDHTVWLEAAGFVRCERKITTNGLNFLTATVTEQTAGQS